MIRPKYLLATCALLLCGCIEREETIVVDAEGAAALEIRFEGDSKDFGPEVALPAAPEWTLKDRRVDTNQNGTAQLHLTAVRSVPYGRPLPHTFARTGDPYAERQLQFPGEIRMWQEGARRFYEFRRTYKARDHRRYNGPDGIGPDKELEERVVDQGIFNVSEKDRETYLESLHMQLVWRLFFEAQDALGIMLESGDLSAEQKRAAEAMCLTMLEDVLQADTLLEILRLDDEALEMAYDGLLDRTRARIAGLVETAVGQEARSERSPFQAAYHGVIHGYRVTDALDNQSFKVEVEMPGEIVATNGFTDPESPGKANWEFQGKDLHDCDLPIYVRSVLDDGETP